MSQQQEGSPLGYQVLVEQLTEIYEQYAEWGKVTTSFIKARADEVNAQVAAARNPNDAPLAQRIVQEYIKELHKKNRELGKFYREYNQAYYRIRWDVLCKSPDGTAFEAQCREARTQCLATMDELSQFIERVVAQCKKVLANPKVESENNTGNPSSMGADPTPTMETPSQVTAQRKVKATKQAESPTQSLEPTMVELNSMVGLDAVKRDIAELVNFLKIQQLRRTKGMPTTNIALHSVFYGNPGTGKTSVARVLSRIYNSLNLLSKGHLIETDRAGLVAGYVGQTALKVNEVVNSALGGVLFIDEAYSLTVGQGWDYGREAIEALLKQMEDHRDDLIVIVAGYTDKMDEFLSSNPGLRSRFTRYFRFDDYSPSELTAIFERFATRDHYRLTPQAREVIDQVFAAAHQNRDETFGNARLARNLFERALSNQANRLVSVPNLTPEMLSTLDAPDILASIASFSWERSLQ